MMQIFIEGNSLKIKGEEKIKQLFVLKKQVVKLQIKKRQHFNGRFTRTFALYLFLSKHLFRWKYSTMYLIEKMEDSMNLVMSVFY